MSKQLASHYLSTLSQEQKQHNTTLRSTADPCWAPPIFPETGRLTLTVRQIRHHYEKLIDKEQQYRSDAKSNQHSACCQTLLTRSQRGSVQRPVPLTAPCTFIWCFYSHRDNAPFCHINPMRTP